MNFYELIQATKELQLQEVRIETPDQFECVVKNDHLKPLSAKLDEFFGPAKKPAGVKAKGEIADLASDFGGVLQNQTLYYVVKDQFSNLAMIWPWSDGARATVKIFRLSYRA